MIVNIDSIPIFGNLLESDLIFAAGPKMAQTPLPNLSFVYDEWAWNTNVLTTSGGALSAWFGSINSRLLSAAPVPEANRPIIANDSIWTNGLSTAAYRAFDCIMEPTWMAGTNPSRRCYVFTFETQLMTLSGLPNRNFGMTSYISNDRGGFEARSVDQRLYMSSGAGAITLIPTIPTGMALTATQLITLGIYGGQLYFNTKPVDLSTNVFAGSRRIVGPSFSGTQSFNNFPMRILGILALQNPTDAPLPISAVDEANMYMLTKYNCPVFT